VKLAEDWLGHDTYSDNSNATTDEGVDYQVGFGRSTLEIIVRFVESSGSRGEAAVRCALPLLRVVKCDMAERPIGKGSQKNGVGGGVFVVKFEPFAVITMRLVFARSF
jgi:alpha-mannosidase